MVAWEWDERVAGTHASTDLEAGRHRAVAEALEHLEAAKGGHSGSVELEAHRDGDCLESGDPSLTNSRPLRRIVVSCTVPVKRRQRSPKAGLRRSTRRSVRTGDGAPV